MLQCDTRLQKENKLGKRSTCSRGPQATLGMRVKVPQVVRKEGTEGLRAVSFRSQLGALTRLIGRSPWLRRTAAGVGWMELSARRCWRVPAREGGRSSQGSGRSWPCAQLGDGVGVVRGVVRGLASAASFRAAESLARVQSLPPLQGIWNPLTPAQGYCGSPSCCWATQV